MSTGQIALSPAFRALDTHDLRRGLRAHGTNRTLACISRTGHARSPQSVARVWDKSRSRLHFAHSTRTISAEGCASSLQNERFVRDFLKNSHVKVCKTSVSYETSSKSQAETPIGAHTSRSPAKQFHDSSPSEQHPLTRQSHCDSDIHLYHNSQPHDSLRLPRESHFYASKPARSPAPATKSHNSIACALVVHVWSDFDPFRAHSHPSKSPFQLRLVTKTELRCHTLKRKSQWHGHIQHPKNRTLQTLIPMELRRNLRISQNAAPVQRNASRFLRDMSVSCKSQWNSGAN